ncbi:BamA/TamA family outer membrane protein [Nafulsella turpanensis]|uniref:BamA/TamA family outer membrane protein n=1 Tax=Nafulsella turpanensis TaxID=1265690 RepID=UPI00034D1DD5|nr:BamA/TamA family outer membrane protein [Nafulsella turpanensis]
MRVKSLLLLCLLCSLFPSGIFAQDAGFPADTTDAIKEKNGGWVALPVVYYTPETRFGFGALGMRLFSLDAADTSVRTSNVQLYGLYTLNKQLMISPSYTLFFPEEKYILDGNLAYFKFPRYYYGIGNDLPETNEELVDYTLLRLENRLLRKLDRQLFAGIQWNYYKVFNVQQQEGGLLVSTQPYGWDGYTASGIGAALVYDSRDLVVNPSGGTYLELSSVFNGSITGSQYSFNHYTLDARRYYLLHANRHILALQAFGSFTTGEVPFLQLSQLGSATIMRGYYQGRYRDKNLLAAQAEYRLPVWWRIGAAAFAGFGDVAPSLDEFSFSTLKPSYGLGLRFMVNESEKVNIRFDYAWGQETSGFYLEITEAF